MVPCYIYEQWFCIHESICLAVIQVPRVCFKVSFKPQLFAPVNPAMILTAINKTFENYCGVVAPLCQGEINHSVPGGRQLAFELTVPFGLAWRLTTPFLTPRPSISKWIPCFSGRFSVQTQNKWWLRQAEPASPVFVCLSIQSCMFYIDWGEIWQRGWLS